MIRFRKLIATLGLAAILSTLVVSTTASAFTDVPATSWFAPYVEGLVDAEIVDATNATFRPAANLNRAEAVKFLVEAFDLTGTTAINFSDVKATDWYYSYVQTAVAKGLVVGYSDGTFGGIKPINRAEWAKVVTIAADLPACEITNPFSDVAAGVWYHDYAVTAYCYQIIDGYSDGTFGGAKLATRAEAAKMISKAMDPVERAAVEPGEEEPGTEPGTEPGEEEPVEVPGGDLSVDVSSDTPAVTTLADGTAFNPMLKLDFTAGSEGSEITGFTLKRTGLSSDSYVKVSAWDSAGLRHGSVVTFSEGYAELGFAGDPITVAAGETETVTFKVNLHASLDTATVAIGIEKAEDVVTNGTLEGTFPLTSTMFGTVNGASSVASGTFDVNSLSTTNRTVDIGQNTYELTKFKIVETSSKEDLIFKDLSLFNNGTTADGDLTNFTLKDQTGDTVATAAAQVNKKVELEFTGDFADGYTVPKGTTRYFSLYVDIKSGASRTGQLIVQNDYDVVLEGATTGASILAIADTAGTDTAFPIGDVLVNVAGYNFITLNEGTLSISKDNSSPSGDVTIGSSEVTLGVFKVEAQGEDVEMQRIAVDLSNGADKTTATNTTGTMECAAATSCDLTGSIKIVTGTGKALVTITASTAALWDYTNRATYVDLSAYHTVKAGTSETLKIVGNLQSNTTYIGAGETITAGINKIYYYKKSSLKYADSASAAAGSLSASTSSLTVSSNSAYGAQSIVSGTSNVKLGSFIVKAGSAEDIRISGITYLINESGITSGNINASNIKFYKYVDGTNDVQLGSTQATLTDNTNATLSVSGLTIAKGDQIQVDVYADTSSNLLTHTLTMTVGASGISGTGITSQSSTTGPTAALDLQVITGATTGTLNVVLSNDNPVSDQVVAGTSGNSMLKLKLTASQHEDIYVKELTVYNDTTANDVALSSLSLYEGDTLKGTLSLQQNTTEAGYVTWNFSGTNRPKVPKNGTAYLTIKGNMVSSQQGTVTNLTPKIAIAHLTAEGNSAVSPSFIASGSTSTDSTADLPLALTNANGTGATGALTGCFVNDAATVLVGATTITVDNNAGATTCSTATLPVGSVIQIFSTAVQTFTVTANTGTALTVTPAVATNALANDSAIAWGAPTASTSNTKIGITEADGNAAFTTQVVAGQVIRIDNEDMYIKDFTIPTSTQTGNSAASVAILNVVRAVNGTTIAAHTTAAGAVNKWTLAQGNAMYVYNTKPTIAIAAASPSGASSASTGMILAEFVVSAANNAADTSENSLTLDNLDITFNRSSVTLANIVMYPKSKDLTAAYAVSPSMWMSGSVARFNVGGDTDWTTGGYDKVVENTSQSFLIRGDVTNATNGSLLVKLGNLGVAGQSSLGTITSGGDIEWDDDVAGNPSYWVKQTASEVPLNSATMTFAAATGTHDSTRPVVTSVTMVDGAAVANSIGVGSTLTVLFSEAMDPSTMAMTVGSATTYLTPGTAATPDNGTKFDLVLDDSDSESCIAGNNNDALRIVGLLCIDMGNATGATSAKAFAATATLQAQDDPTDTQTLVITTATAAVALDAEDGTDTFGDVLTAASAGTTGLKDLHGNYLNTTAFTAADVNW